MIAAGEDPNRARQAGSAAQSLAGSVAPIDFETERSLGSGVAVAALSDIGPVHPSDALQRYVNLVGRSVSYQSSRPFLPYTFTVLVNPTPNAFAGPGGYIFITTGALKMMDNEAQLAGVMAHEVAHVTEKHMLQTYRRTELLSGLQQSAELLDQDAKKYGDMVNVASDTLFDKGLDQKFEYEADRVGLEIAGVSGYDPKGMVQFLDRLNKTTEFKGGWFKTHPSLASRIANLNTQLAADFPGAGGATNEARFKKMMKENLNAIPAGFMEKATAAPAAATKAHAKPKP